MAKASLTQKAKSLAATLTAPKAQKPSKTHPSPENVASTQPEKSYTTGIKGKKHQHIDPDSVVGKLETRLKANGLVLKVEAAHHLSLTVIKASDEQTAQISTQVGENLTQAEADFLYDRAVNDLLGGQANG